MECGGWEKNVGPQDDKGRRTSRAAWGAARGVEERVWMLSRPYE